MLLFQVVFLSLLGISSVLSQSQSQSQSQLSLAEEVVQVLGRTGIEIAEATGTVIVLQEDLPLVVDANADAADADVADYDKNNDYASVVNFEVEISPLMISSSNSFSSTSASASASMLRGTAVEADASKSSSSQSLLSLPPIPPIHPHHSGSVHYSSMMTNGQITYRRDISAPCDNGMLVFTVGVAAKELPYEYDLYNEAYLWSDNAGLCILYPTYNGYQLSNTPFWTLGIDPETVTFTNLIPDPSSMHRISSRQLHNVKNPTTDGIDKDKLGDYVIMAHHNFYNIDYYKQLKAYINSWKTVNVKQLTTND